MSFGIQGNTEFPSSQGQARNRWDCAYTGLQWFVKGAFSSATLAFRGKSWGRERGTTVKNKSTVCDPYLTPLTPHKTQHTSQFKSHSWQIFCYKPGEHIKLKALKVVKKKKKKQTQNVRVFSSERPLAASIPLQVNYTYKLYANDKHKMHRAASQTTLTDRCGDECNDGGWCGRSRSKD